MKSFIIKLTVKAIALIKINKKIFKNIFQDYIKNYI